LNNPFTETNVLIVATGSIVFLEKLLGSYLVKMFPGTHHVHKTSPHVPILSQINQFCILILFL